MLERRPIPQVQQDVDDICRDIVRLAQAVEIVGTYAKADGIGVAYGGAVEVLGEVIAERATRLVSAWDEAFRAVLPGRSSHD